MSLFSRAEMVAAVEAGASFQLLPFWGHTGPQGQVGPYVLSQWYPAPFDVEGVRYATAEHWMMAEKARIFGDHAARDRVVASAHPAEAKAIGREVRGFDDALWASHRFDVVVSGSVAKFGQHPDLRAYLLATGDKVLVEASPRDTVWGVGLGKDNPAVQDPRTWRGANLLGFALMAARKILAAGPS